MLRNRIMRYNSAYPAQPWSSATCASAHSEPPQASARKRHVPAADAPPPAACFAFHGDCSAQWRIGEAALLSGAQLRTLPSISSIPGGLAPLRNHAPAADCYCSYGHVSGGARLPALILAIDQRRWLLVQASSEILSKPAKLTDNSS